MKFVQTGILTCLSLFLLCGCGRDLPPIGPLTGTVTLDGKPYANGSLMFTPTNGGRPSVAATDENGKFEAMYNLDTRGALIGPHTITFEPSVEADGEEDEFKPYSPPAENFKVTPNEITVEAGGTDVTLTLEKS
jgi:hypothetical protein